MRVLRHWREEKRSGKSLGSTNYLSCRRTEDQVSGEMLLIWKNYRNTKDFISALLFVKLFYYKKNYSFGTESFNTSSRRKIETTARCMACCCIIKLCRVLKLPRPDHDHNYALINRRSYSDDRSAIRASHFCFPMDLWNT